VLCSCVVWLCVCVLCVCLLCGVVVVVVVVVYGVCVVVYGVLCGCVWRSMTTHVKGCLSRNLIRDPGLRVSTEG